MIEQIVERELRFNRHALGQCVDSLVGMENPAQLKVEGEEAVHADLPGGGAAIG